MPIHGNFLTDFHDMLQRQSITEQENIKKFNEENPPITEIEVVNEFNENYTAGIWIRDDGSFSYAYKMQNGFYHPAQFQIVPKEIVSEIQKRK
jgi:hypothetical protein